MRVSLLLSLCCLCVSGSLLLVSAMPAAVGLGSASGFGVVCGSGLTNVGPSTILGSIGVSPATAMSGFPPGTQSGGVVHVADAEAMQAQADLQVAYDDAAGRTDFVTLDSAELGGRTLVGGVYRSASAMGLTGPVRLDAQGNPDAVWIIQVGSSLTTASGSSVVLLNGAQACNVFWQISSSATLGSGTSFVGSILALTSISVNDGATVSGRLMARNGAVTLIDTQVTRTTCGDAAPTFDASTPDDSPAVSTPADGTGAASCQLQDLQFTSGLSILGSFSASKYQYGCSCSSWGVDAFTTTVRAMMLDNTASAEVTFNGVSVNSRATWSALSNDGMAGPSSRAPNAESSPLTFRTGLNTIVVNVVNSAAACNYAYSITCTKPESGIVGDPQFVGLRGQQYQVHGIAGEIYSIVSDADLQYNSRFVFLDQGACPVINGRKQKSCWSHPGSYLGELGLKTKAGERVHLVSGSANRGFETVSVNGQELRVGDSVLLSEGGGSVSRNSTHLASVQIGNWAFVFENSDMFVNQRVHVLDSRRLRSHGLLGQTWRETTYPNAIKYIAGQVDDYVIRDNDIFGDSTVFNAFN